MKVGRKIVSFFELSPEKEETSQRQETGTKLKSMLLSEKLEGE